MDSAINFKAILRVGGGVRERLAWWGGLEGLPAPPSALQFNHTSFLTPRG